MSNEELYKKILKGDFPNGEIYGNTAALGKLFSHGIGLDMVKKFLPDVSLDELDEETLNDYAELGWDMFKIACGWQPDIDLNDVELEPDTPLETPQ